jgi:hypothetical protein
LKDLEENGGAWYFSKYPNISKHPHKKIPPKNAKYHISPIY